MQMIIQAAVVEPLVDEHMHPVVHAIPDQLHEVWVRDAAERVDLAPEVAAAARERAIEALDQNLLAALESLKKGLIKILFYKRLQDWCVFASEATLSQEVGSCFCECVT